MGKKKEAYRNAEGGVEGCTPLTLLSSGVSQRALGPPSAVWGMESSLAFPTRCSDALPSCCCLQWDMESSLAFPTRLMSYAEHALRVRHVASSMDAR